MGKSKAGQLLEQFGRLNGKNEAAEQELDADGNPIPPKDDDKDKDGKKDEEGGDAGIEPKDPKDVPVEEDGDMNGMGEVPSAPMKAVKESWEGDPEKEKAGVEGIKAMSESKHPMARKFMEALDQMTSAMDVKKVGADGKDVNEDADGEYMCAMQPEKWAALGQKPEVKFGSK